jgi:predicted transcriptional regulator
MGIVQILEVVCKAPRCASELVKICDCSDSVVHRVIKRMTFYGYVKKKDGEVIITEEGITYLKNVRRYYK